MKRKALFVGINDYEGGLAPLNCACKDANDLCDYFRDVLRYDTHVLRNADILEVRKKINEVTKDLQRGDVFLFFFAGHGFTVDRGENTDRRLATARDPKDHLEDGEGGISLRRLRRLTKGGYSRVFILDACQTKINAIRAADDVEKKTVSKRDLSIISSIVKTANEVDDVAPLWVINSCNIGDVAYELENNGLFTWAFIETLTNLRESGEAAVFNEDLVSNIANKMRMHPGRFNQTPVFFASDEETPEISVFGDALSSADAASMAASSLVLCPICGKKNLPADTFRCRECGSDNLCLRHQDEKTFLCFNCAEKGTQKVVTVVEERKEVKTNSGTQSAISCNSGEVNPSRRPVPMRGYWRDEGVDFPSCSDMALQLFWRAWDLKTEEYLAVAFNTFMCADLEDAEIQYRIGLMLDGGWMGDNRRDEAIKWYKAAANQGHYMGLNGIGEITHRLGLKEEEQKAYKFALTIMDDAAKRGDGRAMYHIGRYLRYGVIDGYENPEVGISWWKKSSEFGNAEAQYWLSTEYEKGGFIEKNIGKSFLLCKAAAEGGYVRAMRKMGKFFEVGVPDVIEINLKEALKWYQFSSERDRGLSIDDINRVTRLLKG